MTPRLYVEAPLAADAEVALARGQAHYLGAVMRRAPGDAVLVFNGRDGEWRAEIAALRRGRSGTLRAVERTRAQAAEPDLWLVFAPVKRAPIDRIAEKATELGVARLVPVLTRHTAAARVNLERLRANAIEAAEQCGRLTVPVCGEPAPLADVVAGWPAERRLMVCEPDGDSPPVAEALRGAAPGPWAVAVGPEGGFTGDEAAALAALPGAVAVSLGPRTLRADTAAIAALACWQALVGDAR